jgi:peptide/nickel transport system substrate-binding protein
MNIRSKLLGGRLGPAALATLLLVACGGTATKDRPGAGGPPAGNTVDTVRTAGGPWGYPSPFAYSKGPGLVHDLFLFDTLLWKDSTGKLIPWLVASWEHTPDAREWRMTMRDGVRWHDGRPVTADDVAFTFDYLTKGAGKAAPGIVRLPEISEVVVEAPNVVAIRLPRPFAPFEGLLGRVPIIPRHVWATVSDPARFQGPESVMGSGPYKLDSYDPATNSYRYSANPDYFLGVPTVKHLEFVPAPDELLSLQRGELDAATLGLEERAVPDAQLKAFEDPRFGRIEAPGELTRALHFNLAKGSPFDDKRFRQAVAYAVDRKDLVTRVLFGRGEPGSLGGLAPSNDYVAKDLPAYERDLGTARSLLEEVGLNDANGDRMRDRPDGTPLVVELLSDSRFSPQTTELVKEHLRQVGVNVTIRVLDPTSADAAAAQGNYQMALIGYGGLGGDPDVLRTRLSSTVKAPDFSRVHGYNNPRFEELAAQQLTAVEDGSRRALVAEMQRIVAGDVPMIPLYLPTRMTIYTKKTFDAWYFTPGGVFGGYPGPLNKHAFVTGAKTGLPKR